MFRNFSGMCFAFTDLYFLLLLLLLHSQIVDAGKCNSCNSDFVSVGRHYWRCKARLSSAIQPIASSDNIITHRSRIITTSQVNKNSAQSPISDTGMIKCVCGRNCKGKKGLRAHSRYCDTAKKLDASYETNNNPPGSSVTYNSIDGESVLRENLNAPNTDVISSSPTNSPDADSSLFQNSDHFKPGLRLPKKPEDWLLEMPSSIHYSQVMTITSFL